MEKSTVEISQKFVAFSEYMNFKITGIMSFDPETREIHCNKKWKEIAIKVEGNSNQSGRK
jgi:hypothetical protein